ncbi:DUF1156 domain-containing protein [Marinobacter sp. DY40_1A1]|uniref:DUF1156 domain-containing protein n=1 Tax=Marinobacter sp. DY40_1A1 TaxID=2583229 RepID=UPI001904CDFD|nr:DUF1156 domain-containing protein [Marinobacter sp. DY40_1A1]MBK1887786.1 DUF1156 domain-containing protein [Marinobacter sp. DY40_1A1]
MSDQRLIEAGFPCHQVGAETQRERNTGKAPPTHRLHVWWARRPLIPSRAAILGSILPGDTDSDQFIKSLGIKVFVADLEGVEWVLGEQKLIDRTVSVGDEKFQLEVDAVVKRAILKENSVRAENSQQIDLLLEGDPSLAYDSVLQRWKAETLLLPEIAEGDILHVREVVGDPAWAKEKMEFTKAHGIRFSGDGYNYPRAFGAPVEPCEPTSSKVILDPTSGGGSIPFEALRLGHNVIANELNPVASVILKATLEYPAKFGMQLHSSVQSYATKLLTEVEGKIQSYFALGQRLENLGIEPIQLPLGIKKEEKEKFQVEDIADYLYCRQVICPHCHGNAPLLNSQWLSKSGEKWAVTMHPQPDKTVQFEVCQIVKGNRGPKGEDLDAGTVTRGVGQCVHCQQAIDGDEIKRQARGESELGVWKDVLYCVVGIRLEPKLDKAGNVQRTKTGANAGQIKTTKIQYFRTPNKLDQQALNAATELLENRRFDFEMKGLVPNDPIPVGSKTSEPHRYGMMSWEELFTPRQLLGHLTAMEVLQNLKPEVIAEHGLENARAIITYLQFMIDKFVDYNSRQTRWITQRAQVSGTFGRHDFSLKWTFGEMVYVGPSSGFRWSIGQVLDALREIVQLVEPVSIKRQFSQSLTINRGSATELGGVGSKSVDAIVMDPPYYNNVQYSELSDFYYVWQKRTLSDLYPGWFDGSVTEKDAEAVANPARDGGEKPAKARYEELMQGIFKECSRVLKSDGIMTVMFTHKSTDAWETLTNSLIQSGWDITGTYPVDSEFGASTHQLNLAAAASTIFIACRPANREDRLPSSWAYEVKGKLESAVREGLIEFDELKLNPVDRMIASWGRALRVYSKHWPVQDGDEEVPPTRAMQEAARVVAEEEVSRLSGGMVTVDDLDSETRLAVIALGINGLGDFAYDDALQMSRSLNFSLQLRNGNYRVSDDLVAYAKEGEDQLAAPLAIKGNKLRLLKPEERTDVRLENPQTLWDVLNGLIVTYRDGGIVAARNFLAEHGKTENPALRGLLKVWAKECRDDALRREAQLIDYEL